MLLSCAKPMYAWIFIKSPCTSKINDNAVKQTGEPFTRDL